MTPINYFKLQAKIFSGISRPNSQHHEEMLADFYGYDPKYFDIMAILLDHDFNEDRFTLMNAQHLIDKFAGIDKWTTLQKASPVQLKLAKMLFYRMHKIHAEDWHWYLASTEAENQVVFDDGTRLDIFTQVFYNVEGHQGDFTDYRLVRLDLLDHPEQETGEKPKKKKKEQANITVPTKRP